jgi:uncharacterized protein
MTIERKWDHLRTLVREMGRAVVAYSGGVDSSLLLAAASEVLGPHCIAVTASSETYPAAELASAKEFCLCLGVTHRIIRTEELSRDEFARNTPDRCYVCKRELFGVLKQIAAQEDIAFILDGANVDDLSDHRPGMRAAREFGVWSPLIQAGLTKPEIRDLARSLRLPLWDKPSMACLASRIPYGTRITPPLLAKVQTAEDIMRSHGFSVVRVRHHGDIARVEVGREEFVRLMSDDVARSVTAALRDLGYAYVCLDLEGYRTGSMNEAIKYRSQESGVRSKTHIQGVIE